MKVKDWSIFRCYAYGSRPRTTIARNHGLLIVDNRLINLALCQPSDAPEYDTVTKEIQKQWEEIPKDWKLSVTALLPEGDTHSVLTVVDLLSPTIFWEKDVPGKGELKATPIGVDGR